MAITLDGTNGILSPDFEPSSSTTPTNGLFLPAANTVGLATGSTERLRIDSSGNLGLGVTPSAWGTAYRTALQVGSAACFAGVSGVGASDYFAVGGNFYLDSGAGYKYIRSTTANRLEASAGEFRWYNAPSGTAGNAISFTQAMTLDASGNLGVGTTSPSVRTHIKGSAGGELLRVSATGGAPSILLTNNDGTSEGLKLEYDNTNGNAAVNAVYSSGALIFKSANTERARIDSSGNLLVGATSSFGAGVQSKTTSASLQSFTAWNAVDSGQAYLFYGGTGSASFTARYQIYWNFTGGTGTAGFLSDYRQKDNVRRLTNGLDAIKALKPSIYRFKDALEDASGFIAHEVQEVIPQAVSGHKDEVDEDGTPKYQMLDQTHIIPYLTAAIQELTAKVTALEAK